MDSHREAFYFLFVRSILSSFIKKQNVWALLTILLGTIAMISRMTDTVDLVTIPGTSPVNFHGGWIILLSGIVLCLPEKPWANTMRRLAGWSIISAASILLLLVLLDKNVFDIGTPTSILPAGHQRGRPAPNSCIAFICIGLSFLLLGAAKQAWTSFWIRLLQAVSAFMVITGLMAYYIDFSEMYSWYEFNRMAIPTAVSVVMIICGIWHRYKSLRTPFVRAAADEGARIVLFGTLLLTGMGFAAGMAGFAVFMNYQETATGNQLLSSAVSLTRLYDTLIEDGIDQAQYVGKSRTLVDAMEQMTTGENKRVAKANLDTVLNGFHNAGFSSLALYSKTGNEIAATGRPVRTISVSVSIHGNPDYRII